MPHDRQLEIALAKIRGVLDHDMRVLDPERCLVVISYIVQRAIGDLVGIPPDDTSEEPSE